MTKLLQAGDRVKLVRDTLMDKSGKLGTVVSKYVPPHCAGAWEITVRWDGNRWDTGYTYPTGGDVVAAEEAA
jgi:hypothetical protein